MENLVIQAEALTTSLKIVEIFEKRHWISSKSISKPKKKLFVAF